MLFGIRCQIAQKSILRVRNRFNAIRLQSIAANQIPDRDSYLRQIEDSDEDTWLEAVTLPGFTVPDFIPPSNVRDQLSANESSAILKEESFPGKSFLLEKKYNNPKLDHFEYLLNKELD